MNDYWVNNDFKAEISKLFEIDEKKHTTCPDSGTQLKVYLEENLQHYMPTGERRKDLKSTP